MMKHAVKPVKVWTILEKLQHCAKAGTRKIDSADWAWQKPETGWKSGVILISKVLMVMPMVEISPMLQLF